MGSRVKVDMSGMKELQRKLNALQKPDEFVEQCARSLAGELLKRLKGHTPVITGNLRRGWQIGRIWKEGNVYKIEIINSTQYAPYVEYGHRQKKGRYVPAIGRSLKKEWVDGKGIIVMSEQELQSMIPQYLERKLANYLKDIM